MTYHYEPGAKRWSRTPARAMSAHAHRRKAGSAGRTSSNPTSHYRQAIQAGAVWWFPASTEMTHETSRPAMCACCGSYARRFLQFNNQDDSYGICRPCVLMGAGKARLHPTRHRHHLRRRRRQLRNRGAME